MSDPQWEIRAMTQYVDGQCPPGWEPFAVDADLVWLRRRVVPTETKRLPEGILTARETVALHRLA